MSKHKFTPGPWHDYQYMLASAIEDANARKICDMSESDFSLDEDEANARLIAVAPEMYKEMERLSALFRKNAIYLDEREKIENILRKVRGESEVFE